MNQKKYEKNSAITIVTIIILASEVLIFINFFIVKLPTYKNISSLVIKKDLVSVIVSIEEKKLIYKNKKAYINDRSIKYEINKDNGLILKQDKKYYQIILKMETDKKNKPGDIIPLTMVDKRETLFEILSKNWKGDG